MKNTGDTLAEYGESGFLAFDDQGVSHNPASVTIDCALENRSYVTAGGTLSGCIVFEIPDSGHLTVKYAPFSTDKFIAQRYLEWEIKYDASYKTTLLTPSISISDQSTFRPQFDHVRLFSYPNKTIGEMRFDSDHPIGKINSLAIKTYDKEGTQLQSLTGRGLAKENLARRKSDLLGGPDHQFMENGSE